VLCFCFVFLHLVYPMLPDFFDCPFSILQRLFNIVVYFFQRRQFGKRKSTREKKAQE